jgi:sensor histidine kinase YesM
MQTQIALQQTEVCLMQSLISPHFLFNCMNTLSSLAFIENAPQTEHCAISLARYLREFLDRIGKTITIREEAEHTQKYIDIQKLRFGKRMEFMMNYDPAVADREIPALILQPIIENSLSHGLKNTRKDGRIQVDIRPDGENVVIEVSDNGSGIREETIRRVEHDLNKPFQNGEKGIGLRSVYYRLNHYFHGHVALHLMSGSEGAITRIDISRETN